MLKVSLLLHQLLYRNLGVWQNSCEVLVLNKGQSSFTKIPKYNSHGNQRHEKKDKTQDTRYKHAIEVVKLRDIEIRYVESSENNANIVTKGLTKGSHEKLRDSVEC